jgi:hypothetical protein
MPPMALTSLPDTTVPFPKGMFSYNIDAVNNEWRDSAIQGNTITVDPNTVSTFISGWAIDANANKSASGVVIKLGDEVITARYGLGSDDIVQYFGEQVYNNCRFEVALNTERLTEEGKFTVYIVSDDNSYVYEPVVYTVKSK